MGPCSYVQADVETSGESYDLSRRYSISSLVFALNILVSAFPMIHKIIFSSKKQRRKVVGNLCQKAIQDEVQDEADQIQDKAQDGVGQLKGELKEAAKVEESDRGEGVGKRPDDASPGPLTPGTAGVFPSVFLDPARNALEGKGRGSVVPYFQNEGAAKPSTSSGNTSKDHRRYQEDGTASSGRQSSDEEHLPLPVSADLVFFQLRPFDLHQTGELSWSPIQAIGQLGLSNRDS